MSACDDQYFAECPLVAARIPVCEQALRVFPLKHIHFRKTASVTGKAPVVDPDLPEDRIPAVTAARIQEMSSLVVGESDCQVASDRAPQQTSVLRRDSRRQVDCRHFASCLFAVCVNGLSDQGGITAERPSQTGPEQRVDYDLR